MSETPHTSAPEDARRLSGWKDIALYLDRGTRTVQRWEREYGLPVRRLSGRDGPAESVFAFTTELDEWLQSAVARRASAGQNHDDIDGHDHTNASPSPAAIVPVESAPVRDLARPLRHAVSNWIAAGVAVCITLMLLATAWCAWRP